MNRFYSLVAAMCVTAAAFAEPTVTFSPASGEVSELSTIVMSCDDLDITGLSAVNFSEIEVKKDGKSFCFLKTQESYTSVALTITLKTTATDPGTYTIDIPAGSFEFETYKGEYYDNEIPYTLTYTINKVVGEYGIEFTTEPEEGSTVKSLSSVTLKADPAKYESIAMLDPTQKFEVIKGTKVITEASCSGSGLDWTFTLDEPIEQKGSYSILLPEWSFSFVPKGGSSAVECEEAYKLSFDVLPDPKPVVYDLEVYGSKPGNGSEIDLENNPFTVFVYTSAPTFNVDPEYFYPRPGKDAKIKVEANDGSWSQEMPLKFSMAFSLWSEFTTPRYDGEYTLTVPEGSYGDEEWLNDPATGHTNKEYKTVFNVIGLGTPGGVTYNLDALKITPRREIANNLSVITLTFPEGTKAKPGTKGYLTSTVARYEQSADAVEIGDGVFSFTFDPAPTDPATYSFLVEKGSFGDEEYMENNEMGQASPNVGWAWDFNPEYPDDPNDPVDPDDPDDPNDPDDPDDPDDPNNPGAVSEVSADALNGPVYNIHGQKVAESVENLPAGLYIVNGQKLIIR